MCLFLTLPKTENVFERIYVHMRIARAIYLANDEAQETVRRPLSVRRIVGGSLYGALGQDRPVPPLQGTTQLVYCSVYSFRQLTEHKN